MADVELKVTTVEVKESNGDKVTYQIGIQHRQEVEDGIKSVSGIVTAVQEKITETERLLSYIPEKNGEKDELGENTETYINEIKDYMNTNIKQKIEKISNNPIAQEMRDKAKSMDEAEKVETSRVKAPTDSSDSETQNP